MEIEIRQISVKSLKTNTGQITGLPANPRFIKDKNFEKLKKSIRENPEMLALRELIVYPYGSGMYVIIGGNMRFRACVDLGYKSLPCKVIGKETTVEQLKAYTIKDNAGYGDWDFDILANEWDEELLDACCLNIDFEELPPAGETAEPQNPKEHYSINLVFNSVEEQEKMESELKRLGNLINFNYTLTR